MHTGKGARDPTKAGFGKVYKKDKKGRVTMRPGTVRRQYRAHRARAAYPRSPRALTATRER